MSGEAVTVAEFVTQALLALPDPLIMLQTLLPSGVVKRWYMNDSGDITTSHIITQLCNTALGRLPEEHQTKLSEITSVCT